MLLLLFSQVTWLVAWAFAVFALPLKIFFHNPLFSFAIGARQLKTQAQQGNWVPGVLALFSRSLILKQFWQYGLLKRRSSDLRWRRRDKEISSTCSDHLSCHLDAWDRFCGVALRGATKNFGFDLLFGSHVLVAACFFACFKWLLYVFLHLLHVQGVAVGAVIETMLPDALLIILPASSPIRQRTSCARLAGSCSSDSLPFSNHLFP